MGLPYFLVFPLVLSVSAKGNKIIIATNIINFKYNMILVKS